MPGNGISIASLFIFTMCVIRHMRNEEELRFVMMIVS